MSNLILEIKNLSHSYGETNQIFQNINLEIEKSELVRDALGDHIFNKFVENKRIEWDRYRTHVSQYEIDKYMPIT